MLIGAERSDINMVKLCLKCPRTTLDVATNDGKTALILAVERNDMAMLKLLLRDEFLDRLNIEHQDVS